VRLVVRVWLPHVRGASRALPCLACLPCLPAWPRSSQLIGPRCDAPQDATYVGLYGPTCNNSFVPASAVSVSGFAALAGANSVPALLNCSAAGFAVTAFAPPSPPPPPPSSQCGFAPTSGLLPAAAPLTFTGIVTASAACPLACGSSCRYGCLVCADATFVGFYGATCLWPAALNVWGGATAAITGSAQTYQLVPQWSVCGNATVFSAAPPPSPPSPPMPPPLMCATAPTLAGAAPLTLSGKFLLPAACATGCAASATNCGNGCVACADGTVVGLYGATCAPLVPTAGNVSVTVIGTGQVYGGVGEFSICASVLSLAPPPPASPPSPPTPPPSPPPAFAVSSTATLAGLAPCLFTPAASAAFVDALSASLNVAQGLVAVTGATACATGRRQLLQAAVSTSVNFSVAATTSATAAVLQSQLTTVAASPSFAASLNARLPSGSSVTGVTMTAPVLLGVPLPPPAAAAALPPPADAAASPPPAGAAPPVASAAATARARACRAAASALLLLVATLLA
jgi:hypothetical protein